MRRHYLYLIPMLALLAGCTSETGLLLDVSGPSGVSSSAAGVTSLELVVAHPSWCERWVEDLSASRTRVAVGGRDLSARPYSFLLRPVHLTDVNEPLMALALARDASDRLVGAASFPDLRWRVGDVVEQQDRVQVLSRASQPDGPVYDTADGCVCMPGQPWIGLGTGMGCDVGIPTSYARLMDTAGCELPPGSAGLPVPVCDGQLYPGEVADRALPCFAATQQNCHVAARGCHDGDGRAYNDECLPPTSAPALPSSALCDAYLACERRACGDLIGCFRAALTPVQFECHMQVDRQTPIRPCADGQWQAVLDAQASGADCVTALLDGNAQPPLTLSLGGGDPFASSCPPTLTVSAVDAAASLETVPLSFDVWLTLGDHLARARLLLEIGCTNGPSLTCTRLP
jgi:hypothetical protein